MTRAKYPLEAAEVVRNSAQQTAEDRLAQAIAAKDRAVAARESATRALAEHRKREAARVRREEDRQQAGCTAAELQRAERYRVERRADEARAAAALMKAHAEERRAIEAVVEARRALGRAAVDVEAVARHRERWERDRARESERAVEDEAEDLAASRRR